MRTCAICGFRDATHVTSIDDRKYYSCDKCDVAPNVDPRESINQLRARAARLLDQDPNISIRKMIDAMGVEHGDSAAEQRVRRVWREFKHRRLEQISTM